MSSTTPAEDPSASQRDGRSGEGEGPREGEPRLREGEPRPREGGRSLRPSTDSMADGVRTRTTYAVSLDMFEGPLDLLLHLVRRHELDILDIPIAFVTEKYIEYIGFARSLDIEIAGEYLLMAATLAFLKSRELLPPAPGEDEEAEDEEDGVDPREELIRRLIEYERFREAGDELGSRPLFGRDVFPRGGDPDIPLPDRGLAPVTLFRLAEAYNRVLDRAKVREDHEVVIEAVTVRQRMQQLSLLLTREPRIGFEALFLTQVWSNERELRQMLVVTLMSVLEMVKLGLLGVHQAQGSDTLELERAVEVTEMTEVISTFREEGEDDLDELTGSLDAVTGADELAEGVEAATPAEPVELETPVEPDKLVEPDLSTLDAEGRIEIVAEPSESTELELVGEVEPAVAETAEESEVEPAAEDPADEVEPAAAELIEESAVEPVAEASADEVEPAAELESNDPESTPFATQPLLAAQPDAAGPEDAASSEPDLEAEPDLNLAPDSGETE